MLKFNDFKKSENNGLEESKINESSVDYDVLNKITKLPC